MRKLRATDLDGTIVFDRTISDTDLAAMARWRDAGHLLVVDTGKSVFATRDVLDPIGMAFDYGVVFTGAVLVDGSYEVLSARFIPEGVAQEVAAGLVGLPGVTTFATTIDKDYVLSDNIGEVSPILAVFEDLDVGQMAAHQFIGVPMRVIDDGERDRLQTELTRRWAGVLDCHRNQEFLDLVPAGSTKGAGLTTLLAGPLAGEELEVWTIGDSWNDIDMHQIADHAVALPWSPPEVSAVCGRTVATMAELIDTVLGTEVR